GPELNRGKRVYAQLEAYPHDRLTFTLGGDYASSTSESGSVESGEALTANAFLGYSDGRTHVGLEAYLRSEDQANRPSAIYQGLAVFARSRVAERMELVVRYDYTVYDNGGGVGDGAAAARFIVIGAALSPDAKVHVIP